MLSAKNHQICCKIIDSAIAYCNTDLLGYKGKTLEISYSIKENNEYNAAADITTNPYVMTINSGVFEKAFKILNTLLCSQNEHFYFCVALDNKYDPTKANVYLDLLFEYAAKFIVFHELGHIYNGHVDYFINNKQLNIERQVIEMDADAFSATRCVGQLTYDDNIKKINEKYPELIKSKVHALLILIIAASVAFAYWQIGRNRQISNSDEQLRQLTYLPHRTRRDYFCRCALNAFKKLNPESSLMLGNQEFNMQFLREVLPNIEQYMNLYLQHDCSGMSTLLDSSNNIEEMNRLHLEHCNYLDQYWNIIMRNKLLLYSYFDLAE